MPVPQSSPRGRRGPLTNNTRIRGLSLFCWLWGRTGHKLRELSSSASFRGSVTDSRCTAEHSDLTRSRPRPRRSINPTGMMGHKQLGPRLLVKVELPLPGFKSNNKGLSIGWLETAGAGVFRRAAGFHGCRQPRGRDLHTRGMQVSHGVTQQRHWGPQTAA